MGKISDALEKSLKDKKAPLEDDNNSGVDTYAYDEPSGSLDATLKKSIPQNDAGSFSAEPVPKETAEVFDEGATYQYDPEKIDKNLICHFKSQTVEAEQFRILKTNIMFPEKGDSPRTIMVTSAMPGEGKSFVAANLSISLAQNIDDYVLLMDCDMRLPTIHKLFGFEEIPGLSSYLAGEASMSSLLVKTAIDKLTILPGGKPPHNPSELLSSHRMANLIDEVRSRYRDRYVVIDTPPPQLTAEANALAKRVDGIILVVKYGSTNRDFVRDLKDMFGAEKIIGVVFNQFDLHKSVGYGYGYGQYGPYGGYYGDAPVEKG